MKNPRLTKQLLEMIDYCQFQHESSCGEILSDMTEADFVDIRAMVEAIFST